VFGTTSGAVVITPTNFTVGAGQSLYLQRNGDTLILTDTPVPEPHHILLIASAVLGVCFCLRRRRVAMTVSNAL